MRWNRIARDPIHSARSLDTPIDAEDPEGPTLGDYLPSSYDVAAEAEERVYNEQLHEALEKLLSRLAPDAAELIRQSYFSPMGSSLLLSSPMASGLYCLLMILASYQGHFIGIG